MTYEEEKKLIEAAKVLKDFCKDRDCLLDCLFYNNKTGRCNVCYEPGNWLIPTITRWTPEDVALAKALKEFGVVSVQKNKSGVKWYSSNEQEGSYLLFPKSAFDALTLYERVYIDTIISEAVEE